jgi:hypothetical protein
MACLQVMSEVEALHASAADELEALYEARLALEAERLAQALASREDAVAAGREELARAAAAAAAEVQELHATYK